MNCPKCHKPMPLVELKEKSARYECDEHGSHEVSITEEERSIMDKQIRPKRVLKSKRTLESKRTLKPKRILKPER